MPRPTKRAQRIAKAIDPKDPSLASRVQRQLEDGYGPEGGQDEIEHFLHLQPRYGPGKDPRVVVIRLAEEGWPDRRLREILAGPLHLGPDEDDPTNANELVDYAMGAGHLNPATSILRVNAAAEGTPIEDDYQVLTDLYRQPSDGNLPPEPDLPAVRVRAALLPIALAVSGEPLEPEDAEELGILAGWEPGDRENITLFLQYLGWVASRVPRWLETATADELVSAVQAAARSISGDPDTESHWLNVGRAAPAVALVMHDLVRIPDATPEERMLLRELDPSASPVNQGDPAA
jgi:hypothetical protein